MKYLLTVAYDGANYHGFQKQNNGISVQQVLTEAANGLFGECRITGCSRTDSGVHAIGFKATLECAKTSIPADKVAIAMNCRLPDDVSVLDSVEVDEDFHPRYSVKSKEYRYVIHNNPVRDPFLRGRAYHYPRKLDTDRMNKAASCLVGEHDFSSFMASGSKIEDTVRKIEFCNVVRDGDTVTVCICGNGFLYNMVRIIVGTLIEISEGRCEPEKMKEIIDGADRRLAGPTAPPEGLYLYKVDY